MCGACLPDDSDTAIGLENDRETRLVSRVNWLRSAERRMTDDSLRREIHE
jgi:hypothetical protein